MSATKPDDLTLVIQKVTEGLMVIMDRPTDNDLIEIRQIIILVLMKTTYDELTLKHNILGAILPAERYGQIYKNEAYVTPPVIPLYDDKIDKDATRLEINCAKGKHEARWNDMQLYEMAKKCLLLLHHGGGGRDVVQGAQGPRYLLHEGDGPQAP